MCERNEIDDCHFFIITSYCIQCIAAMHFEKKIKVGKMLQPSHVSSLSVHILSILVFGSHFDTCMALVLY